MHCQVKLRLLDIANELTAWIIVLAVKVKQGKASMYKLKETMYPLSKINRVLSQKTFRYMGILGCVRFH